MPYATHKKRQKHNHTTHVELKIAASQGTLASRNWALSAQWYNPTSILTHAAFNRKKDDANWQNRCNALQTSKA